METVHKQTAFARESGPAVQEPPAQPAGAQAPPQQEPERDQPLENLAINMFEELRRLERLTRGMMLHDSFSEDQEAYIGQYNEIRAQIMLAVRSIEEARGRMVRLCQFVKSAESVFDLV